MKAVKKSRIATLMVHTSPLDQAGVGDAGGMNIYVVESAKKMAQAGVEVDIFTRANHPNLPESVEIADGVNVKHLGTNYSVFFLNTVIDDSNALISASAGFIALTFSTVLAALSN